jgi:hypothetical protein
MEMSCLSGLTYRAIARGIAGLFLAGGILAGGPEAGAQTDSSQIRRAFAILAERGEVVFEFYPEDAGILKRVNQFASVDRKTENGFEVYANLKGFRSFLGLNLPFTLIELAPGLKSTGAIQAFPGEWDVYPTHNQYFNFMEEMAQKFPGICRLDTIGRSVMGRPILVMKITDHPDARESEPAFVYSSTMHGNELTGYVLMLRLIEHLLSMYGTDDLVTRLVDRIEIWINPLANPDGTYWQGDEVLSNPKRFNANNADLNRNFPGIMDATHPDSMQYQPENLAQMDFLGDIYMVMGANIHGGEEVVNYPFDTWASLHADDQWYRTVSRAYAELAQARSFPVLYMSGFDGGITNGWEWYQVEGSRQDWVNWFNHAREVTIEISRDKIPPPVDLPFYWHYNHPSLLHYMEACLFGIHGVVRDAVTGEFLKAGVWVKGHDGLNSGVFSDPLTGFFARPIEPGTYDLKISASGYEPSIIEVQVEDGDTAWVEVRLFPMETGTGKLSRDRTTYPPFIDGQMLHLNILSAGSCRIDLYDLKGSLVMSDQRFFASKGWKSIHLGNARIGQGMYLLKIRTPYGLQTHRIFQSEWK